MRDSLPNPTDENSHAGREVGARRPVVVYYNGTFVHLRNGAHMRMTSLLRYLVDTGCDVTLFSFANHPTEPWTEEAQALFRRDHPGVQLVLDEYNAVLAKQTSQKNAMTSFFPAKSRQLLAKSRPGASPNYEKLVAEKPDAVWIVNYADGLTQLNGLPAGPVVVETHDLKFVNVAKKNNASPFNIRSLLRLRSELGVLDTVAGLIAISPVEAGFFRAILAGPRTFYVPQYGAARPMPIAAKPDGGYRYDLLFVGSEMFQNSRGLLRFCRDNADWLPGLRIAVAGKVGDDPEVRAFIADKPNIERLGFVDDMAAVYAASKAAISPVDGTGLKIKVIDALGHGVPVFGSDHTLEGLAPGYEACAFPITRDYIEPLLRDEARLDAARRTALAYWRGLATAGDITGFGDFLAGADASPQASPPKLTHCEAPRHKLSRGGAPRSVWRRAACCKERSWRRWSRFSAVRVLSASRWCGPWPSRAGVSAWRSAMRRWLMT